MENGKQNHLGSDRILLGRNNDDSLLVSRVSSQFIASESTFEWASLITVLHGSSEVGIGEGALLKSVWLL